MKLWVAVAFFAVGGSLSRLMLVQTQLLQKLGTAVFLPARRLGMGYAVRRGLDGKLVCVCHVE